MAYYVYLLASKKHGTLYLGVTNDLVRRGYEHRTKQCRDMASNKLVWFEIYDDVSTAIAREKELKKWRRDWKIRLIEEQNPGWRISIPAFPTDMWLWIPGSRQKARPGMTSGDFHSICHSGAARSAEPGFHNHDREV